MNLLSNLVGSYCRQTADLNYLFRIRSAYLSAFQTNGGLERVVLQLEQCDNLGHPMGGHITSCWAEEIVLEPKEPEYAEEPRRSSGRGHPRIAPSTTWWDRK